MLEAKLHNGHAMHDRTCFLHGHGLGLLHVTMREGALQQQKGSLLQHNNRLRSSSHHVTQPASHMIMIQHTRSLLTEVVKAAFNATCTNTATNNPTTLHPTYSSCSGEPPARCPLRKQHVPCFSSRDGNTNSPATHSHYCSAHCIYQLKS